MFKISKKHSAIMLALLIGVIFGFAFSESYKATSRVESMIINALKKTGFQTVHISRKTFKKNTLVFHDIGLDQDKFSKIHKITVRYSLFDLLIYNKIESVTLDNAEILATLDDEFSISISDYNIPDVWNDSLFEVDIGALNINNFSFDILSPYGGIKMDLNLQASPLPDHSLEIRGKLATKQKLLSFEAPVHINYSKNQGWHGELTINNARAHIGNSKVSRLNASIISDGKSLDSYYTKGEISAGALTILGLDIQDILGTLELASNNRLDLVLSGNFKKSQQTQANLNYTSRNPENIHAFWQAQNKDQLHLLINGSALEKYYPENTPQNKTVSTILSLPISELLKQKKTIKLSFQAEPDFKIYETLVID